MSHKCPKCSNTVILETKKDRDTGMWENYWFCEDHGKVEPNLQRDVFIPQSIDHIDVTIELPKGNAVADSWVKLFGGKNEDKNKRGNISCKKSPINPYSA